MTRREEIIEKAQCIEHYGMQEQFAFIAGAQWADKTMIEKSISWFYKNVHKEKYWDVKGYLLIVTLMEDYRKAMED